MSAEREHMLRDHGTVGDFLEDTRFLLEETVKAMNTARQRLFAVEAALRRLDDQALRLKPWAWD